MPFQHSAFKILHKAMTKSS